MELEIPSFADKRDRIRSIHHSSEESSVLSAEVYFRN
jgi:hypothetical protein